MPDFLRAMVSKIITALDTAPVVDSDDSEQLVQEMHRHLLIGGSNVIFEYNQVSLEIVGSECPEGCSKGIYTVEFNTRNVFWVDHRVERILPSTMIDDHVEFLGGWFWDGVYGGAIHSRK